MLNILSRAEMDVVTLSSVPQGDLQAGVSKYLEDCNCSVHILGTSYTSNSSGGASLAEIQFNEAFKKLQSDKHFRMFIWYPPEVISAEKDPQQDSFISRVKNSISMNMVFAAVDSPIQLVDDIRSMTEVEVKETFNINAADVFVIFNQLDNDVAEDVIDMLSDIVEVSKLNIVLDSDTDYSEYVAQQMDKSKLAVVYFKESADWAVPFAQQIWKRTGGASTPTPILLIGDKDPSTNQDKKFAAPQVTSLIVPGELIPLEIKVQYDKLTGNS